MKVRASYKRIGRNPFKIGFDNTDFYTKTVDVPDDYDWKLLEYFAIEDTQEGFEFIQIARIDQDITNANERVFILLQLRNLNKNRQIMKKLTKEQVKELMSKKPHEMTKDELCFLFEIFCFQIKEYYLHENNISFEIHFKTRFLIRVNFPIKPGMMSFNNEFIDFGEEASGISMTPPENTKKIFQRFFGMFHDFLIKEVRYNAYYVPESSIFSSFKEADEYLQLAKDIITNRG